MRFKNCLFTLKNLWFILSKNWKIVLFNKYNERRTVFIILKQELSGFKCGICRYGIGLQKVQNDNSKIYFCNCKRDFRI